MKIILSIILLTIILLYFTIIISFYFYLFFFNHKIKKSTQFKSILKDKDFILFKNTLNNFYYSTFIILFIFLKRKEKYKLFSLS